MKRIFCTLLALVLCFGALIALSACNGGNTDDGGDVTTTDDNGKDDITSPEAPAGNKLYSNDDFSFAYPEDWILKTGSVPIIADSDGSGNNITVAYEPKTTIYKEMTMSSFSDLFKPALEAMGLTVSNVSISQVKNSHGVEITKMTYNAANAAATMKQTIYCFDAGSSTYSVTVTEMVEDYAVVQTVFNTIYVLK